MSPASDTDEQHPLRRAVSDRAPSGEFRRLGKFEIRRKIGSGGMGTVYLAFDAELKRTIALKVLPREKAHNPTLVKRFKAEAQAAAHLKHDHIVTVYEAGKIDDYLYIALEYVEGCNVHDLISHRGPFSVRRSAEIIRQVTEALEHIHQRNIVHRDIKPSNLLITRDGVVKVTDLGLARSMDEADTSGITRDGTTVGTVDYMAPEQARNSRSADIRSDLYSLGCTWYHMLTGEPPYSAGSLTSKLQAHVTEPIPDPRAKREAVPDAVAAVLRRMMAKKPIDRYSDPGSVLDDLEQLRMSRNEVSKNVLAALAEEESDGSETGPRPAAPPRPRERQRKRPRQRRQTKREQRPTPKPPSGSQAQRQADSGLLTSLAVAAGLAALIALLWLLTHSGGGAPETDDPTFQQNPFLSEPAEPGSP